MSEPAPVDPEVAAALLRSHLEDFFANSPRVREGGWAWHIAGDPLTAIVQVPAKVNDSDEPDLYTLQLDATYYDTWPVSATFVEAHDGGWRRARLGSKAFPFLSGSPDAPPGGAVGFEFALHDNYHWPPNGIVTDQLICFSYNFGYYTSGHNPTESQRWRPGVDRLDATLTRIHTALTSPAYVGPSSQPNAA